MKRYPAQDLEPAERDPKKLRRTAFILVGLMVVGSLVIIAAYNRNAARMAEDDRPSIATRLNQNFKLWRQDESEAGLLDTAGDVIVVAPVVFRQPESWDTTRGVLGRLHERFGEREDFRIVCITLDPENEPPGFLADMAEELGAELPGWWLAGAKEESVHKFFKNRLEAGIMPYREDGELVYDPALAVIGRNRHVREATVRARDEDGDELNHRNPVRFDFEQAERWDEEGRTEGLERSNVETLEALLHKTVEQLLAEEFRQS